MMILRHYLGALKDCVDFFVSVLDAVDIFKIMSLRWPLKIRLLFKPKTMLNFKLIILLVVTLLQVKKEVK
jgi:hypothetical protein